MHSKTLLRRLLVVALTAVALVGCGTKSTQSTQPTSGTSQAAPASNKQLQLTDQAGRKVAVPSPAQRMVVLQHHSLDTIAMLGGQKRVVGVMRQWQSLLGDYMKEVFPGIESLPQPGSLEDANVEEVAKLRPDVVIVAPQFNKDKIQQLDKLGIPVVVVAFRAEGAQAEAQNPTLKDADKAYTDGTQWAVKTLGELTETSPKADRLWNTALANRAYVAEHLKAVPEEKRARVFIANEKNMTYGTDKYVSVQLERAGGINVAVPEIKGYKEVAFEKVAKWNPDTIIVQDRYKSVYDAITTEPKWQPIAAVRQKRVFLAPSWTKPWGNPAPDSIALGELWLAHLLYPTQIEKSYVEQKATEFYRDFYGVPFKGTI